MNLEEQRLIQKNCQNCGFSESPWLYSIKNSSLFGFFHICNDCKSQLETEELDLREFILKEAEPVVEEVVLEEVAQ